MLTKAVVELARNQSVPPLTIVDQLKADLESAAARAVAAVLQPAGKPVSFRVFVLRKADHKAGAELAGLAPSASFDLPELSDIVSLRATLLASIKDHIRRGIPSAAAAAAGTMAMIEEKAEDAEEE